MSDDWAQSEAETAELLQVGNTIRLTYPDVGGKPNPNNETVHVRAIVDDDQIVTNVWSRTKQRWVYEIRHRYFFELHYRNGYLTLLKRAAASPKAEGHDHE